MTTEIEETSTPKVVNWDVAEERDFEKLRVEMDEHKDKIMELESKAVLLYVISLVIHHFSPFQL